MFELHPIARLFAEFTESKSFNFCMWAIFIILFFWLVRILYRFFAPKAIAAFEEIGPLSEGQRNKISRLVFFCTLLLLLMNVGGALWVRVLRGRGYLSVFGVGFGYGLGPLHVLIVLAFIFCAIRLVHTYHKSYRESERGKRRPIRAFVNILYVLVCSLGVFSIMSVATKERPIMLMSTFGAVFAIFIFAFKDILSSVSANLQLNAEKLVKVGDWIKISSCKIDGIVESISARTIRVRNWDMSLASFPVKMLMDISFCNYSAMQTLGARQIRRPLIVDQRSVRFLTQEEVSALKENHLLTDEMLKRAESFDDTSELAPSRLWTNLELFCLYTGDYLGRRKDIRHDMDCMMRTLDPAGTGIPVEIYCYCTETTLVKFEERQRAVVSHLLAVLPMFHLRISQVNAIRVEGELTPTA